MCVVMLTNSCSLLAGSKKGFYNYEELGDTPIPTYTDDDDDIIETSVVSDDDAAPRKKAKVLGTSTIMLLSGVPLAIASSNGRLKPS